MYRAIVVLVRLIAIYLLLWQGGLHLGNSIWLAVNSNSMEPSIAIKDYAVVHTAVWLAIFGIVWMAAPWLARRAMRDAQGAGAHSFPQAEALVTALFVALGAYWIGDAIMVAGRFLAEFLSLPADRFSREAYFNYNTEIWIAVIEAPLGIAMMLGASGLARAVARARRWG